MAQRPPEDVEAYQHELIAERIAALRSVGQKAASRPDRQNAGRILRMTVVGHLRRFHGVTRPDPTKSVWDVVEEHQQAHAPASDKT